MDSQTIDRRDFVTSLGRAALLFAVPVELSGMGRPTKFVHPEPRPGVDASGVLPSDQVATHVAELFDEVRRIPHIVDGIGCHCGCGAVEGMRSLLSCYEGGGMAQYCMVCEGEGRLAVRLAGEGRSLEEIRTAVDRNFG